MNTPDHRLHARRGLQTRSCFNGHDVLPSKLRVVEIGIATIVVCGPTCEAEARARILLRVHGSLPTAFRQALHDWQKWTGRADVTLTLLDCAAKEERLGHSCSGCYARPCQRPKADTTRHWKMRSPRKSACASGSAMPTQSRRRWTSPQSPRPRSQRGAAVPGPYTRREIVTPSRSWRTRESVRGGAECCRGPQRPVPVRQGEAVQAMSRARSPARASQINPGIGGHRPEDTSHAGWSGDCDNASR